MGRVIRFLSHIRLSFVMDVPVRAIWHNLLRKCDYIFETSMSRIEANPERLALELLFPMVFMTFLVVVEADFTASSTYNINE